MTRLPLLAICLAGCAQHATSWRTYYLDQAEVAAVQAAADEWTERGCPVRLDPAGDGVLLKLGEMPRDTAGPDTVGESWHMAGQTAEFIVIVDNAELRARYPDWQEHIRITALHEFGHSLGFGHVDNPASIMYAYGDRVATHVTEDCRCR